MSNIIIVGFIAEGKTDVRFLKSIIQRTFEDVAFECDSEIIVHSVEHIEVNEGTYVNNVTKASQLAYKSGVMALCLHVDADSASDINAINRKITPATLELQNILTSKCDNLVPLIPVQEIECWMLADMDLLKREIGTTKTNAQLGLQRDPESVARPKELISESIRIAFEELPRRRKRLEVSELYLPIGQKISIASLSALPSYQKFKSNVRQAYVKLNYLAV